MSRFGISTTSAAAAALVWGLGCTRVDEPPRERGGGASSTPTAPSVAQPSHAQPPALGPLPSAKTGKLSWTRAPAGDVAKLALTHAKNASAAGRTALVYVGAPWCEPCQHFHKAAERGDLDARFGDLAILELDAEEDGDRLRAAGYTSTYIPLLVVPGPDGRGTERKMSGSIKGEGAVAEMTPRLAQLLGR